MKFSKIFIIFGFIFQYNLIAHSAVVCDETFPSRVLRFKYEYNFHQLYTNKNLYPHGLNKFSVEFIEKYDYNGSPEVPNFQWTDKLKSMEYIIPANAKGFKIIESSNYYVIGFTPPVRQPGNLQINYTNTFYGEQTPGNWVGPVITVACQPYEISWCGDGVKDVEYGEDCDDGGENGKPGKCSNLCK